METTFVERLDVMEKLVLDLQVPDRAAIATIRNLVSSLRERPEAEAKRMAELMVTNQKLVAENAKLKAEQPSTPLKITRNLGIGKMRNPI